MWLCSGLGLLCLLVTYASLCPDARAQPGAGSPVIIGVNDGSGWGAADSARFEQLGITSDRVEAGERPSVAETVAQGWRNDLVIVGNVDDEEPLYEVDIPTWTREALAQVQEAVADGQTLLEVGNEMYLKGPRCGGCGRRIEPVKYAEMFVSLSRAVQAAHIPGVQLIFDGYGDYQEVEGKPWSQVWSGGGWIADAVRAEPELRSRVDGFAMHPYGEAGENRQNDSGTLGLRVQHEQAVALGFEHTDFYATEYGVAIEGKPDPSSLAQQAHEIEAVYRELIAFGYVKGIWYFQTHDDPSGEWGLIEPQESGQSPFIGRPSLRVLAAFAQESLERGGGGEAPALVTSGSGPTETVELASTGIDYHLHLQLTALPWSNGSYD
jgi:hypothetical protein